MTLRKFKISSSRNTIIKSLLITVFFIISISTASIPSSFQNEELYSEKNTPEALLNNPKSSELFENELLYTGVQDAITINETAVYSSSQHFTIGNGTNPLYTSQNAEFPIDDTHDWEGYYYNSTISNIRDERDWIDNGDIGSDMGLSYGAQTYQTYQSSHNYGKNLNPTSYISTIDGTDCDYMRLHFVTIDVEYYWDALYISDQDNTIVDFFAGYYSDFYTPWYSASTLKISMSSDNTVERYGYYVDFFETYNGSMFTIDSSGWNYYENTIDPSRLYGGSSEQGNHSALWAIIEGIDSAPSYSYEEGDEAGFYQDLTIPRGEVIDAWVSMDYNLLRGIETNDNFAFLKINGEIVYSRGFRTITNAGLGKWHSTGLINIDLWENSSAIFNNVVNGQSISLSVGIEIGNGVEYTGFNHLDIQEAYFDNIKLILKTSANSTQSNINIEFDGFTLTDSSSDWGSATFSRYNTWDSDPMQISMTVDAPKIEFDLSSTLYGYHTTNTASQSHGSPGSQLTIYTNETIRWTTYHNVYIPTGYNDFQYTGEKPRDWEIYDIEDPTGLSTVFNDGNKNDSSFSVDTNSFGWWKIYAESTNMLETSNTELLHGTWQHYLSSFSYDVGESVSFRTDLNMSVGPIANILATNAELKIYNPDSTEWYTDNVTPDVTGSIEFPSFEVGAGNSSGGIYQYRIIWTNGTAAGGLNGTFEIKHNIQNTILYPRDAILDSITEAISGDVVPIRLLLNDSNTGVKLSGLNVEYNWTSGIRFLTETSAGIYDTTLDTIDLSGAGTYMVDFNVSGEGFYDLLFSIEIDLVSETELKIIGLDSNIDYGTNFTIRLDYHQKPVILGITEASISLNLTDYYVTEDIIDGEYTVDINSSNSFTGPGTYDIQINASRSGYITKELVTRIQILPRSVYFQILIDSSDCTLNKSYAAKIQQDLNFTIGVYTTFGDLPVTTGTIQISNGEDFSPPFSLVDDYHFGIIESEFFGLGVNFISVIFNETGYQSASEILQISITRISINIDLQDGAILAVSKRDKFTTRIYIEDPRTSTPILNATVSYSWIFGTGYLTEIGNGIYEFSGTAPSQEDQFVITFTVTTSNPDYEIATITLTLVTQPTDTPIQWWWFVAGAVVLVSTLSGTLIAIGVKNKKKKRQEEEITKLKQKTQIFDDITNIKGILVTEKHSGLLMYRHVISGLDEENEELFSGFVRAILLLGKRFIREDEELEKGMVFEKQEFIEFTHENFKILLAGGHKIIVALILEQQASESIKQKVSKFIEEFEGIYASVLEGWSGNRSIFMDTTPKLFEEIFNLSLLRNFHLSDNCEIYEKKFIQANSLSEQVSNVIKTLHEEKETFHLKTLISLIPEEDKLAAKDVILKFVKGKYIVPQK